MRVTALAAMICLSAIGLSMAADAQASIKKPTHIPAEALAPALKELAKARGVQVVFRSEVVGNARTRGASGDLTTNEALSKLLEGTDLAFAYVDARTVTVAPKADLEGAGATSPVAHPASPTRSSGDSLRLAQTSRAAAEAPSPVEKGRHPSQNGDDRSVQLEEIVVSAQKRDERIQDVPVSVTAISGVSLAETGQPRLEDYYTRIPGLSLTTTQPFGSSTIAIRGIVTGYYQSPTVGIVVDDVPYTSSTTVGFGNAIADFDPGDLARVEVLRGPQGTLYGASSIGGLVKYVTVDPSTSAFSGRVQVGSDHVENGSDLGYDIRGAFNVPISDTFAARASAFYRRDPGYIDDPTHHLRGVNWGDVEGGLLSALWRPSDTVSLKLSALLQDDTTHGMAEVDLIPGAGDLQQDRPPGSGGYHKSFQIYSANLKAKPGGGELTFISAYAVDRNDFKWDFSPIFGDLAMNGIPGFLPGFGVSGVVSTQNVRTNKWTEEARYSLPLGAKAEWLIGLFYGHEHTPQNYQLVSAADFTTGVPVGELAHLIYLNTFEEYAAFTDLTYHFTDRFDVQIGGRESHNKQDFDNIDGGPLFVGVGGLDVSQPVSHSKDNAFTYLLTPRFKFSENLMTYARLASGYRPGGPNGGVALNSKLPTTFRPDKTESYEVGVKGGLARTVTFDASVYYINWRDIQLQLRDPVTGITYYSNAGGAKSQGVELSLEARPIMGLTVDASATYDDAVLTRDFPSAAGTAKRGDRLPFTSRFSGNLSVDDEFPLLGTVIGFVGGSLSYVGGRLSAIGSTGQQNYPAYAKADLRAGVRYDAWTASLFANNITDRRGLLNIDPPHAYTFIEPRTIGVSLIRVF